MADNVKRERRNEKIKIGFKRKGLLKNDNWGSSATRILLQIFYSCIWNSEIMNLQNAHSTNYINNIN